MVNTLKKTRIALGLLVVAALVVILNSTTQENSMDVPAFTPVRDDAMAAKFAPQILQSAPYGNPEALLYRASKHDSGDIHITYHYVWEKEENTGPGWKPFLSRWLYTGGLGLQRVMFGKKDIERVSLVVAPSGDVTQLSFETAESYSDSDFGVKHRTVTQDGRFKGPLLFEVMSWNHLFRQIETGKNAGEGAAVKLVPSYFTETLWQDYTMVKAKETRLSRNRAHQLYEREFVAATAP